MDDEFDKTMHGQFSQMEQHVGTDAYIANVDVQRSVAEYNRAQVKNMETERQVRSARTMMLVFLLVATIPFWLAAAIYVWKMLVF